MKKRRIKILLSLVALCLLLQSCIFLPKDTETTTTPQKNDPKPPTKDLYLEVQYTYALPDINEAVLKTDHAQAYLLLANKTHPLGEAYSPADLMKLTCPVEAGEEHYLEARAAQALYEMFREMQADGITDVVVTSSYRSYANQRLLYNHYLEREMKSLSEDAFRCLGTEYIQSVYLDCGKMGLSREDAERVVDSYSARAGQSEHQTGLCVDLITPDMNQHLTEAFENTAAFAWLSQNAHRFGFILRYPKGKEGVTQYTYEPWHYRYVGREAATNIYLSGLTLEEYLEKI